MGALAESAYKNQALSDLLNNPDLQKLPWDRLSVIEVDWSLNPEGKGVYVPRLRLEFYENPFMDPADLGVPMADDKEES